MRAMVMFVKKVIKNSKIKKLDFTKILFFLIKMFLIVDEEAVEDEYETCDKCSSFGFCKQGEFGECCECRRGYFGNGKYCVADGLKEFYSTKKDRKIKVVI